MMKISNETIIYPTVSLSVPKTVSVSHSALTKAVTVVSQLLGQLIPLKSMVQTRCWVQFWSNVVRISAITVVSIDLA